MRIAELIQGSSIELVRGSPQTEVCEIVEDSRVASAGCLFVARAGTESDGSAFIEEAVSKGSVAILGANSTNIPEGVVALTADSPARAAAHLAERFNGHPATILQIVGITGTNGKTTIAHLVHHLLTHADVTCGLIGTVQIDDGAETTPASLTTPSAIDVSRLLRAMVNNHCTAAAIEVSSHALDQDRVAELPFDVAVFSNLSGDHLDYHQSMDDYAQAKARLFRSLSPDACAVINIDDPNASQMVRDCSARVLTTSLVDPGADCFAKCDNQTIEQVDASFRGPWGKFSVCLPLVGEHNVANALQAAAACWVMGLKRDALRTGLNSCSAPPGRLEPVTTPNDDFTVFVDYAHTDDALGNVLQALRPLVPEAGRLRVVFGCGGDRDRTKRPRMAEVAARYADELIITSDNPRTEDPQTIIDEILVGVPASCRADIMSVVDRRAAIEYAIEQCGPNDVVLIAGKGHEPYQIIGTQKRPFDDRRVAAEAIASRTVKVGAS
ncbi:MAG: UDP-N-acetylmuramoyl-L-alanyl-D-glutamate--2,6-diaminopimelate ligase [Phycisphaerales bacterium]